MSHTKRYLENVAEFAGMEVSTFLARPDKIKIENQYRKAKGIPIIETKPVLTRAEVGNIIDKLQGPRAEYEERLLDACYDWLKNYNRRKYGD